MNKLSKIAIVSSLSILGVILSVGGVIFAQETNSEPVDMPPSETKEAPQGVPSRGNPNQRNRAMERRANPSESKDNSPQAIEQRANNMEQRELNVAERTANREQRIKDRCEAVGMRILNHQEMFTSKSQARLTKYNQITTRLETVSTRLAEKGVDVITYNSYITELKSKITALNTLNQEYTQLFGSKANTGEFCNNKEQLATEVETRKAKLQLVIAKDKEIRMYIKETILPYLKSIKPEPINTSNQSGTTSPASDNSNTSTPIQ